jgi:integrase
MPRPRIVTPTYRLHRATGQATSEFFDPLTGLKRQLYLGPYGSLESRQAHARLCREVAAGRTATPANLTVSEVALAYLKHAHGYYQKDGRPTDEVDGVRAMIRAVVAEHGDQDAAEFGPLALRAVRQGLIDRGLSRTFINAQVGRVRRMFRWAVGQQLIRPEVLAALEAVEPLLKGRSQAREKPAVKPVTDEHINITMPFLNQVVGDMVRVQRLTGCRPGEVCAMAGAEIDRSGDVWVYTPASHKTEHHDRSRIIHLGPQAQAVLRPYILAAGDGPLFGYQPDSYRRAVARACQRAGVPRWFPNQIRHTVATELRSKFGVEGSRVTLGHADVGTTQIYAERDALLARRIAGEVG